MLPRDYHVKLILISGMRTSTLLKRLPYLPKADAYVSEVGGRIFYPITPPSTTRSTIRRKRSNEPEEDVATSSSSSSSLIRPVKFPGSLENDLEPFTLVEDMYWRSRMSKDTAAGLDGYYGDIADAFLGTITTSSSSTRQEEDEDHVDSLDHDRSRTTTTSKSISLGQRKGALWDFANSLVKRGFVVDFNGYACCFRVNRQQQSTSITEKDFNELTSSSIDNTIKNLALARSVNLGCIDFYPAESGKKNCCAYLARKFSSFPSMNESNNQQQLLSQGEEILSQSAICLCDDDNDLEMAFACQHVYLPSVSSVSMAKAAPDYSQHFSLMG